MIRAVSTWAMIGSCRGNWPLRATLLVATFWLAVGVPRLLSIASGGAIIPLATTLTSAGAPIPQTARLVHVGTSFDTMQRQLGPPHSGPIRGAPVYVGGLLGTPLGSRHWRVFMYRWGPYSAYFWFDQDRVLRARRIVRVD